jgi:hypothetical protein
MASDPSHRVVRDLRVAELLDAPRYEVIPVRGIEEKAAALPAGSRVTVTASPGHGQARTIEVAESLAASGYEVIPHLAARMVSGRSELAGWAERLEAAATRRRPPARTRTPATCSTSSPASLIRSRASGSAGTRRATR